MRLSEPNLRDVRRVRLLFGLDIGCVDYLRPLGGISFYGDGKFLRRIEGRLKAELRDSLAQIGLRRDLHDICMHLVDDGNRRAGWRQQPKPRKWPRTPESRTLRVLAIQKSPPSA